MCRLGMAWVKPRASCRSHPLGTHCTQFARLQTGISPWSTGCTRPTCSCLSSSPHHMGPLQCFPPRTRCLDCTRSRSRSKSRQSDPRSGRHCNAWAWSPLGCSTRQPRSSRTLSAPFHPDTFPSCRARTLSSSCSAAPRDPPGTASAPWRRWGTPSPEDTRRSPGRS